MPKKLYLYSTACDLSFAHHVLKNILRQTTQLFPALWLTLCFLFSVQAEPIARIGDIARLEGVRKNQLMGTGIVIGLNGSGDNTAITKEMVLNTVRNLGMELQSLNLNPKNAAAVVITAELPPFASPGDTIDVTVSTVSDAKSLKGGILLQAPLRAANGKVYAVAQGPLSIGAAGAHPTVARVPNGALIEKEVPISFVQNQQLHYLLANQDFSTAQRIAETINLTFAVDTAKALNAARIQVKIPYSFVNNPVEFVSIIDNLQLSVSSKARVVINERTGTVVFGGDVKISPIAIAHNNITIQVGNRLNQTGVDESIVGIENGSTVQELIQTLNLMGIGATDLIVILQEVKNAGAMQAELEIM